ncbi:MAG: EAL domain-containing protein, partial [Caldilineaceae bacterium]|nr:EAL domain-containing protein [Caldilineaceae bacterium]
LQYYNVDVLKIAAPFVAAMSQESGGMEIVRTIINLAHDLNLQVIAEGVETPQQYAQLQALKCEYGQGRYFSHTVSGDTGLVLTAEDLPPALGGTPA